jgi:serine phosphatase RsbU (regulator of sigma subunit)
LVIPLLFGEKILGALDLCSDSQNAFKQNDVVLFETLADNIAVAIRNADLYRSEQWRRQVAESMKEVVGLLSADVALDEVLDRILIELEKTLPTDISAIWLLDNSDSESGMEQFTSSLHLGAFHLNDRASSDDSKGMTQIHELLGKFDQKEDNINSLLSTFPWITEILESKQAVIREPRSSYEPFGGLLSFSKEYSAIGAPLQINNQTIGLLVLVHHLSGKYGIESQLMTTTFASYAAVAIENTRLFEAAHDQAWVSTVLLQVAEATQSITSLNELLETVVNIIPGLIGINACAIYLWDSTVDVFYPATSFGFDVDHLTELNNWMISQDSISEFNRSLQSRTPINSEVSTDEILSQSFSSINFQNDLLIIFPMVAQSSLRGAILVDFNSSTLTKNSTQELWDEKFSIIQGIAHQTAVAVESIQLIEAQEEEAYISVALLQVAQAIVSLNQLDEILGSIVRITPILVGVKRCIIYLWDNNNSIFRLSQSYGFSKADLSLMGQTIGNEDFLFIETIRQKNQVVYHVFIDPLKSPISWKELIPADLHIVEAVLQEDGFQIAGESENEYLKTKSRLLIGFPLSVKGEVLGVMLTEEEDPIKGPPSYHIREKRLEIVKGITQQAAIAIKNELLQKEAVKSERMERELQLAREIQTTFLPERIPDLPGWDVDIRWQPARQVGGDFYDIIELGDNNLGFVIADVADKGMPAALFMTLIRTLIRAAAKDKSSPAAVLKQVNELLIPDAKHGMFVTVFYSVLSLNTGKVLYANAGHNPPILRYYLSEELHELIRTGMALGVMDGIEIEEREVCLRPGDYLLCYTDGVTEAFSVSGEAYGNQRLFDVVSSKNFARSKELLDEIENSINMFIEGAPLSDDLTLAAFFRKNM